tara:strand:+ start:33852 stop:34787 length:936 start_codon:yes stop_codon:yes gene_type:complete
MQLATYIKDLLYRYECVIIPGFGAFLTQHQSAHIDAASQTFYPPSKTLSFNRQLQTNDGLLAHYVASVEGISYETALATIRNFTGSLSLRLSEGETVPLENIGSFVLNAERKVQFEPDHQQNFNTASFGLSTVVATEIQRELAASTSEETPVRTLSKEQPTTTAPYIKYAAVGLIAVLLSGWGGLKWYEKDVQEHNFAEKQRADSLLENDIQEATFLVTPALPTLNVAVRKNTGKYHIIAGAFRIQENAEKKVEQLISEGYSARQIGQNKYGLHQVVYASYEDRLEALRSLRDIKRSQNKDAWLLVQELSK